jgi:hypothetical protein
MSAMKKHIANMGRFLVFSIGLLAACGRGVPPPPATPPVTGLPDSVETFEGRYLASLEVSSFVPCGMEETPGDGNGYWLVSSLEMADYVFQAHSMAAGTYGPDDGIAPEVYVRFLGALSAPAGQQPGSGFGRSVQF